MNSHTWFRGYQPTSRREKIKLDRFFSFSFKLFLCVSQILNTEDRKTSSKDNFKNVWANLSHDGCWGAETSPRNPAWPFICAKGCGVFLNFLHKIPFRWAFGISKLFFFSFNSTSKFGIPCSKVLKKYIFKISRVTYQKTRKEIKYRHFFPKCWVLFDWQAKNQSYFFF